MTRLSRVFACCFIAATALFGSPRTASAMEIDLDEALTMGAGEGVVVFSFTYSSIVDGSTITQGWRKVGETEGGSVSIRIRGLFANEELSKTGLGRKGKLAALRLPGGLYEFYQSSSMGRDSWSTGSMVLPRKFRVTPGQVTYVGNLDLLFSRTSAQSDAGLALRIFIGIDLAGTLVSPLVRDESAIDLPLIAARNPQLTADRVRIDVILDPADKASAEGEAKLMALAQAGNVRAAQVLEFAYLAGQAPTPEGDLIRIPTNADRRAKILSLRVQLAEKGETPGDHAMLCRYHDPDLRSGDTIFPGRKPEPTRAGVHCKAAADRYDKASAKRLAQAYGEGQLGLPADPRSQKAWEYRHKHMSMEDGKALPQDDERLVREFERYWAAPAPKVFMMSPSGRAYSWSRIDDARGSDPRQQVAERCNRIAGRYGERCHPYHGSAVALWAACQSSWQQRADATTFPDVALPEAPENRAPDGISHDLAQAAWLTLQRKNLPRAFAYSAATGNYATSSGTCLSASIALRACEAATTGSCELIAVDDRLIAGTDYQRRLSDAIRTQVAKEGANFNVLATTRSAGSPVPERAQVASPAGPRTIPDAPADSRLADIHAVPFIGERGKDLYEQFLATNRRPRAFAISLIGSSNWATGPDATEKAKEGCERFGSACFIYALDDRVLWDGKIAIDAGTCDPARVDPKLCDVDAVPVRAEGKDRYKAFLLIKTRPRAFVVSEGGGWRFLSGPNATERALELCRKASSRCQVYAEDDKVVLNPKSDPQ
jgi:hypothetical protein